MILSYSSSTSAQRMTQFLVSEDLRALGTIQRYILSYAWSPIVWANGTRLKMNFMFSDLCALDFDSGAWSVADARAMLEKNALAGLIGTTKSHTDAAPRFRLIMPWDGRITCAKTYEQNMKRLTEHMPADKAAKDAARFFWPCKEIVFYRPGAPVSWLPYTPERPKRQISPELKSARPVPTWIETTLKNQGREGNRNNLVYWVSKRLKDLGFTPSEAESLISPHISLDGRELSRTVLSAFKNTT